MFSYLLKSAWRNLQKNKLHTFINIAGLTLGLSCAIVVYLILDFDFSFDKHHKGYDRIYRVVSSIGFAGNAFPNPGIPTPLAGHISESYPEIVASAPMVMNRVSVKLEGEADDEPHTISKPIFTTPNFFKIFEWEWVAGSPETALEKPNAIVLTESEAEKLFAKKDAMGQTLQVDDSTFLEVTGVVKNQPHNSNFRFGAIASYEFIRKEKEKNAQWTNVGSSDQFMLLLPEGNAAQIAAELEEKINRFFEEQQEDEEEANSWKFILQPLSDIHYNQDYGGMNGSTADINTLRALVIIGLFLLLIGSINYVNLATAIATNRAKEVGIRKTLGSSRMSIIRQYLSETATLLVFSIFISLGLAELFLLQIDTFMNLSLEVSLLQQAAISDPKFYGFLIVLLLAMTLLAGGYPALVLSGYHPVEALKNRISSGNKGGMLALRRALVVFQFGISQALVLGALVVYSQLQFSKTIDLGFKKGAVLNISLPYTESFSKREAYKNSLSNLAGLEELALSMGPPVTYARSSQVTEFPHADGPKKILFDVKMAEADWFNIYGFEFLAGGVFHATDSMNQAVINETLLKKMGLEKPEDAIGVRFGEDEDDMEKTEIVGVVSDFHTASVHKAINPLLIAPRKDAYFTLELAIDRAQSAKIIAAAEQEWKKLFPDRKFRYNFFEENLENFYKQEERLLRLFNLFAGIAGLICCLGLYGLVSFMAVQKTKEIGIRKVLGANIGNILYLFFKEFLRLIFIALLLSLPLGYYGMNKWLEESFAYKISIGPGIMLLTILGVLLVTVVTISYQSVRAALANPANSLRSE